MPDLTSKNDPIRIKEADDAARQVVVHPTDDDLFVLTGKQAIDGCRLGISIQVWLQELDSMTEFVCDWCRHRENKVSSCFMAPRAGNVLLFVTPTRRTFDFDLADELVDLNTQVIQKFRLGRIEVHQVPREELDRFVELDRGRFVYGNGG